ncbi:ABC transporter ATP-binding protein [Allorhizocola rhizosphaerae]|uniref:ABC transporter ATP-binding protein n=1 Tax=Allorhizocola rhizosphaerae TaxID=1872709 RepID=UPI000E3CECD2|nr:ABC transporter ATP-binding protein [Allorhizocola rhizosphaerae]
MLAATSVHVSLDGNAILRGVDLAVAEGEWVTIIGPNGAGKSTFLRAVGGFLPYSGSILLSGTETGAHSRRQRARIVASVAQQPVVPPGIRVFDYVLLGRTPYIPLLGRESLQDLSIVEERLHALDLLPFASRRLDTLSGGERQRVYLARALAQSAPLLLLDEPTSALDIGHQQEVLELVDGLRRAHGLTVLATMHDLSLAGEYADRLVLMSDGTVAASGPPSAVLTEELLRSHYRANVRVIDADFGPVVVPVR